MIKKIKLNNCLNLNFYLIESKKYLVLKNEVSSYYFLIPNYIQCNKEQDFLVLNFIPSTLNVSFFNNYVTFLIKWLKSFEKPYRRTLILKGLGLKANLINNNKTLELKLGFSNILYVSVPNDSFLVHINKNNITFESYNLVELGNFIAKIRSLKVPNVYKGKGIWYKNEIQTLKVIKKT
jgi:large subunit ribosomal protein L6